MVHHDPQSFEPADFLKACLPLLPRGRALDVAMGNGRNALLLAANGFDVEGVDRSREAVDVALREASARGLPLQARVADLERAALIPAETYMLIICFNYLQRSLIPAIRNGLKAGGMIVYETFTVDQARFGRPRNPDYLLRYNELLEMFRGLRCLRYHEGIYGERAQAGILAQKVAAD